jgi:para-aminobenzoate synthetase component 1
MQVDPALAALAAAPRGRRTLLLHSGRHEKRWAERSLLAEPAVWFRYTTDRRSELFDARTLQPLELSRPFTHNFWHDLRHLLNDPAYPGRWVGCLSYDLARLIEPTKLMTRIDDDGVWPLAELAWCPQVQEIPAPVGASMAPSGVAGGRLMADIESNFTHPQYLQAVAKALDYICAGDIFQVNLSQRFNTVYQGDPRALYHRLAHISPAWFGAFLELPPDRPQGASRFLLSTSPELFLDVRGRTVVTRPIKGTLPGAADPGSLARSQKDIAELNMIVDLMRNDLGRVCAYGSIKVLEHRRIETHPTLHHGVATIQGELHPSRDIVDLLRATLPGGSVTGTPKVRAMQIIDELEPAPRGPYCGCIGFLSRDAATLNMAIRTMELLPIPRLSPSTYSVSFSVGGGIVADSQADAEYEETLAKARAMMIALSSGGRSE